MKAILHIGTPKTATTYLQNALMAHRRALQRAGIVYPDMFNTKTDHIALFCAAHPFLHPFQNEFGISDKSEIAPFRDRLKHHLARQVAANPGALFVMSSENLAGNLTGVTALGNLRDLLAELFEEIEVVVYLRRQDEAFLSIYSEFMRKGFSGPTFDRFIERNTSADPVVPYLDYDRLLCSWAAVFGAENLRPRIFEAERFEGGTVLSDFLSLLPDAPGRRIVAQTGAAAVNASLSAPALEFLRIIQPVVPFGHKSKVNPERTALNSRIDALPEDPAPVVSRAQETRILDHFETGNQKVADTYFPQLDGPLFPRDIRSAETSNLGQLSLEQFRMFFRLVFD